MTNLLTEIANLISIVLAYFLARDRALLEPPKVSPIKGNTTDYTLLQNYVVSVELNDWRVDLKIKHGFVFDGASIPRLLWPLCGHPFEGPRLPAALVHDYLYRSQILKRSEADLIYAQIMAQNHLAWYRILIEYLTLRFCGQKAWQNNAQIEPNLSCQFGTITYYQKSTKKKGKNQ